MNAIIGQKSEQLQRFLEDGRRIPVTVIRIPEVSVTQLKTVETDGYAAVQLGVAAKKDSKAGKSLLGHIKKSGAKTPLFLREIRLTSEDVTPELGSQLKAAEILEPGDIVWVTGMSKGKGFAGGVKRYGFRGGPRTHGQSDRERAPGSIGQTTTPGRVYKGKRMAGNMGNDQVTVKNLVVVSVNPEENSVMLSGLVPGILGGYVTIAKKGSQKNFTPLLKNAAELAKEAEEQARQEAEAAKVQEESQAAQEAQVQKTAVDAQAAADEESSEEVKAEVPAEKSPVEETPAETSKTEETEAKEEEK